MYSNYCGNVGREIGKKRGATLMELMCHDGITPQLAKQMAESNRVDISQLTIAASFCSKQIV